MQRPPCRFGPNCKKLADNSCNFYHAQMGQPNYQPKGNWTNPNPKNSFMHQNKNGYSGNQPNYPNQPNNYPNQQNNYSNQPNNYQGNQQNSYFQDKNQKSFNQPYQNPKNPNNNSPNEEANVFCRDAHFDIQCKFGEKCRRKHGFISSGEDNIKRMLFTRKVPTHPQSKLTTFHLKGKDYFALRCGNDVNFFDFDLENSNLVDLFKWSLPETTGKYHYYGQKNQFIYYAIQNPKTTFTDLGCYNFTTQKTYYIQNAHQNKVTGMAHFDTNIMLSASLDGQLKVWLLEGQKYIAHKDSCDRLKQQYNSMNAKLELYFLDISDISGQKIITTGTSDNRLLFFIGTDLAYKQVVFPEQYSKIFNVKYYSYEGTYIAMVLAWNSNSTVSAVVAVSLSNFEQSVIVNVQNGENNRLTINIIEVIDNYLLVGSLNGQMSIYGLPSKQKVGLIMHQNPLSDVISTVGELKATNIKMRIMFILEKQTEQKEGSFGVYLIK